MNLARLRRPHAPWLALLGCALLLRALVPAGWMPVPGGQGFTIELCSDRMPGGDPEQLRAARELFDSLLTGSGQRPAHGDEDGAGDQPCTFAAASMPWSPAQEVALAQPARIPSSFPIPPLAAAVGRGLAAPPPPATGPPLLS